ncbi:UNVERIFIED_CONTAM: protein SPIRAL1-like 5 [Sesamum calycinum]|uniref:Protein SPIRAL1-like 5 n=1 Tax=Sesamum calycinum TaxID=2727403 RepID=A0AAW2JAD8_9LAMI
MKRGGSSGGGQSSLGYLFGSDSNQKKEAPPTPPPYTPPYGIDMGNEKPPESPPPPSLDKTSKVSNNYNRVQGQNSGNFITGRPSTKVTSAPGGDSSLGYLFGDKSS